MLTECKNENERLHNNIAAEQAISSKLNLENERLQIDVASERAITSKLILENDRLKNDIVTERNAISELNNEASQDELLIASPENNPLKDDLFQEAAK
jgi:hypothetical protein